MATLAIPAQTSWLPTRMMIGGRLVEGAGQPVVVRNPSSGEITTKFSGASIEQVLAAIKAARAVADKGDWAAMPMKARVAIVRDLLARFAARIDDLRALIVTETGMPVNSFALDAQIGAPLRQMDAMLDLCLKLPEIEENPITLDERVNPMGGFVQSIRRFVPVGVVAAISAYNFPLHINLWKILPALATGNAVILRPSPLTPLSALALAEIAAEAGLPKGVLSVIAEAGAEGAQLLTIDPAVNMVSSPDRPKSAALLPGKPRLR